MKQTSPRESAIRDYLFSNLAALTPGSQAIDREVHLRNPDGADGFIDIPVRVIRKDDAAAFAADLKAKLGK